MNTKSYIRLQKQARIMRAAKQKKPMASKSYVKKQIAKNADLGFLDTSISIADTHSAHTPVSLVAMAEGLTDSTREGQEIQLKSLWVKLQSRENATTATSAIVRVMVFKWFNSVTPASNSVSASSNTVLAPIAFTNMTTTKTQYRVLWTRTFTINIAGQSHIQFQKFLKLNGKTIYTGSTGADDIHGGIYIQCESDLDSNGPATEINCRLRYYK